MYIYKLTCLPENKIYIGQSIRPLNTKYNDLMTESTRPRLWEAITKYGRDSFKIQSIFKIEIIEQVLLENADKQEAYWIKYFNSCNPNLGYNMLSGGRKNLQGFNSPRLGKKHSEKTKETISKKKSGVKLSEKHINAAAKGHYKKILCVTTGKIYNSLKEAKNELNLNSGALHYVLIGKRPHTKGLVFKYLD